MQIDILKQKDELFLLQVRLFRLAQINWNVDSKKCSEIFNKYEIYDYIETCYDFFHIQGDEENFHDIMAYLNTKGFSLTNISKYEYTMELLSAMTASEIARRQNISKTQAFDKFIQSETANMLFDEELCFWWNGPDYLADEYEKEMAGRTVR